MGVCGASDSSSTSAVDWLPLGCAEDVTSAGVSDSVALRIEVISSVCVAMGTAWDTCDAMAGFACADVAEGIEHISSIHVSSPPDDPGVPGVLGTTASVCVETVTGRGFGGIFADEASIFCSLADLVESSTRGEVFDASEV